jgi:hypothetical protein
MKISCMCTFKEGLREAKVLVVTWGRKNWFLSAESTLVTMLHNVPSFGCS